MIWAWDALVDRSLRLPAVYTSAIHQMEGYFRQPKPWENDLIRAGWHKRSGVLGILIKITIWVNDQSV